MSVVHPSQSSGLGELLTVTSLKTLSTPLQPPLPTGAARVPVVTSGMSVAGLQLFHPYLASF